MANQVRVGTDDALLIGWPAPLPDGERVVLWHDESGAELPVEPAGDRLTCTTGVGDLAPGRWELRLEAGSLTRPLLTDDPGGSLGGMRGYAARARDRSVTVTRSPGGHAALAVRDVVPHAEVEAVHPRDGEILITGLLAYTGPQYGGARLVAAGRRSAGTVTRAARVDGVEFRARLPIGALAARPPALWDLFLDVTAVHARLATRLDDAPGKRGKLSFPIQVTAAPGGGDRTVRPYYTAADELSVACHEAAADGPA
ncbi:hypothetical protein [Actinomadura roseirufa]|uniref:hypothetical protein n=1 Tax=Actinomadura roseirufa TaxID=2094049 RepID=UPI001040FEC9|nr:hypothetical protein [Actinomadura roseirufa]